MKNPRVKHCIPHISNQDSDRKRKHAIAVNADNSDCDCFAMLALRAATTSQRKAERRRCWSQMKNRTVRKIDWHSRQNTNAYSCTLLGQDFRIVAQPVARDNTGVHAGVKAGAHAPGPCFGWSKGAVDDRDGRADPRSTPEQYGML